MSLIFLHIAPDGSDCAEWQPPGHDRQSLVIEVTDDQS